MSEKVCPKCGSKDIENHRYNPDDHGLIWEDHWICKKCGKAGFKPADVPYNQLEDIVPPLALCKKIPAGLFEKSALFWGRYGKDWWVNVREFDSTPNEVYPAPTLLEIIDAIEKTGCSYDFCEWDGNDRTVAALEAWGAFTRWGELVQSEDDEDDD